MTAQIIPFPARPVIQTLTASASPIEEARFHVSDLRAKRDACDKFSREWHVQDIKLHWWSEELASLAATTNDNIIPLRRA